MKHTNILTATLSLQAEIMGDFYFLKMFKICRKRMHAAVVGLKSRFFFFFMDVYSIKPILKMNYYFKYFMMMQSVHSESSVSCGALGVGILFLRKTNRYDVENLILLDLV